MKVLVSWVRDFVDVIASADEIAKTMSVRGFAVEGLDVLRGGDAVIDFEVTGNRPDCMCVMGMAREIATASHLPMRSRAIRGPEGSGPLNNDGKATGPNPRLASLKVVDKSDIDLVSAAPELCPRYAGGVANVTVGPS